MGLMDGLAALGKIPAAREAISGTEKLRREKTREALRAALRDGLPGDAVDTVVERHLDSVLAAASQGNAIREVAKVFGVWDTLRVYAGSFIDQLEGKK